MILGKGEINISQIKKLIIKVKMLMIPQSNQNYNMIDWTPIIGAIKLKMRIVYLFFWYYSKSNNFLEKTIDIDKFVL